MTESAACTVVIPCYHGAAFLETAFRSVGARRFLFFLLLKGR